MTRKGLDIQCYYDARMECFLLDYILFLTSSGSITEISNVYEKHDSDVYSIIQVKLAHSPVLSTFLEFPQNLFSYSFADTHFSSDLWFGSKWLQWLSYRIMIKISAKWYQLWFSVIWFLSSIALIELCFCSSLELINLLICSYHQVTSGKDGKYKRNGKAPYIFLGPLTWQAKGERASAISWHWKLLRQCFM
jgi:hypothetical protein